MSERPDLTIDQVEDLEALLRAARRRTPLLVAGAVVTLVAVAVASFSVVFARDADQQIHALSEEAAANQRQAQQFQVFLQHFIDEENYVCGVVAAEAKRDGLPPPPRSVCAVVLPTTRPQPPVAPQSAPTATAVPATPRPTTAPAASARTSAEPAAVATPTATPISTPPSRPCLLRIICLLPAGCSHSLRKPTCG